MPTAGVGIDWHYILDYDADGFNPFMPTAGVGMCCGSRVAVYPCKFQSFYAHSGRWNRKWFLILLVFRQFQSFYAHSGRWNNHHLELWHSPLWVSILLCPQRALEFQRWTWQYLKCRRFNPFMPTAGVGISFDWWKKLTPPPVSILLCPQRALEYWGFT